MKHYGTSIFTKKKLLFLIFVLHNARVNHKICNPPSQSLRFLLLCLFVSPPQTIYIYFRSGYTDLPRTSKNYPPVKTKSGYINYRCNRKANICSNKIKNRKKKKILDVVLSAELGLYSPRRQGARTRVDDESFSCVNATDEEMEAILPDEQHLN